ncbi:MAG: DUF4177 domain-containing protein [Ktedonobacterales bacterium]|nr:DUF4177 domain-containing protein [Ktedonobacterales bacterium]
MQKWDYQTLETTVDAREIDEILTKAGETGWEVVAVTPIIATNASGQAFTKCFIIMMKRAKT